MAFPQPWMDELLYKNDIVSVISSYVELKPKGHRYWGLCPLHGEKTPSFSVNADKQLFYCFGCHAGGNVISFIQQMDHLTFPEAVAKLAQRAGMQLPEMTEDADAIRERAHRERLYAATRSAARYYMETLLSEDGLPGRRYLSKRHISSEAVKRFGIGYAKAGWDNLKNKLTAEGFSEAELLEAGLLVKNDSKGTVYDAYRDRVIFPILDINSRVLGFGARVMTNEKPKYINTGDTPIYNKRNNLYGLHIQKGQRIDSLFMVEGYTDVIGLFENGVTNAVASLGTALTVQQARLLKRYVNTVYIAYDGDSAGQNATIRGLDILTDAGIDVRVIVFPDDMDPDEFIRKRGRDSFDRLKDNALSLNSFKLESMARAFDLTQENDRERYVKAGCTLISKLEPVEQERYYKQLALKTGYPVDTLKEQGKTESRQSPSGEPPKRSFHDLSTAKESITGRMKAEAVLLVYMERSQEAAESAVDQGAMELIRTPGLLNYAYGIIGAYAFGRKPSTAAIMNDLNDEDRKIVSKVMAADQVGSGDPKKAISGCIERLRAIDRDERIEQLRIKLADNLKTKEELIEIMKEINELSSANKRRG